MDVVQISRVKTFDDILCELRIIEKQLDVHLHEFRLFNKAYYIVTGNIKTAAANGYFDNPKLVEKFTVAFAHYYFQALNQTINADKNLPPAWQVLRDSKKAPEFLYLLLGANAHIGNDLPLVLLKMAYKSKGENLLDDVYKVDKILVKSGREIIYAFSEPNKLLNFLKDHFVFIYYRLTMRLILSWRNRAWNNYQLIKKVGVNKSNYQKNSIKTARRLSLLSK